MSALMDRLRRLFRRRPEPEPPSRPPPPAMGEESGAHGGDDPEPLHRGRRRLKETYTSHWDLDYLPRDEVEKILDDEDPPRR
ncbi:hypothetical protein [Alloalcanivorax profundimaris]|nr:hypothetical protein [Alloalcanivorax profundimaris]